MARPHKQTVDYFPHDTDASDGKTLTIIQSKFGNDGYAFWFKLLQLLGKTPGHYYDFNNPAAWEFLLAKTSQKDTETMKGILDTLSLLEAIDQELYENGIIWCQKFVDGIEDAYSRTVEGVPQKPKVRESLRQIAQKIGCSESYLSQVITGKRPLSEKILKKCLSLGIDIKGVNVPKKEVSAEVTKLMSTETPPNITLIPQTKLKETKREDTKLNKKRNGEFQNVLLTDGEFEKLIKQFGEKLPVMIENLSAYKESKGKVYKNDYATILTWDRNDNRDRPKQGRDKYKNQKYAHMFATTQEDIDKIRAIRKKNGPKEVFEQ